MDSNPIRVRLLRSPFTSPPIGSLGTLYKYSESCCEIIWDNLTTELKINFLTNSYELGEVLRGYSTLTMEDVLYLSGGNTEYLKKISDKRVVQRILREYRRYTSVLLKKARGEPRWMC